MTIDDLPFKEIKDEKCKLSYHPNSSNSRRVKVRLTNGCLVFFIPKLLYHPSSVLIR